MLNITGVHSTHLNKINFFMLFSTLMVFLDTVLVCPSEFNPQDKKARDKL